MRISEDTSIWDSKTYCAGCTIEVERGQDLCEDCEREQDKCGFDYDDQLEAEWQERCENANNCKCGAWQFTKDKMDAYHCADCCCGET